MEEIVNSPRYKREPLHSLAIVRSFSHFYQQDEHNASLYLINSAPTFRHIGFRIDGAKIKKIRTPCVNGKNSIFAANTLLMVKDGIIDGIREVARKVLPQGSSLYLYGSRARGDHRDDSDWDLLLLLDKQKKETGDFDKYAYPIIECGFDFWQYFSVQTYTKNEWYKGPHAMFFYNVEQDKKLIYES